METSDAIRQMIIALPALILAITTHEVSHGYVANRLGDPTARLMGRLTLNPIKHIDPVGTVLMPLILYMFGGIIIGYAKPVPINPANFHSPKKDMAISAAAGPITNILLAIASSLILHILVIPIAEFFQTGFINSILYPLALMLKASVFINVILAAINLMPILPLDGGRVLVGFLPHNQAMAYSKLEPYGILIFIALIVTGIAGYFIFPLVKLISLLVPFFTFN